MKRILMRIAGKGERRDEALCAALSLAMPHLDNDAVADMIGLIPELPTFFYRKWVRMFTDRLMETASSAQITDLCQGTPESDASLLLVYVMFMESARMEKIVADDLIAFAKNQDADTGAIWGKLHRPSPREH